MADGGKPAHGDNRPSAMFFWPTPERPTAVRSEGIQIWDDSGKRYIDASSGPQTTNIGHGNARVVAAMAEQAERLTFAFRSHFLNEPAEELAREIAGVTPDGFDMVFFNSGGSEAVETAIKAMRRWGYTKKGVAKDQAQILVAGGNFHGRTTTIVSFSDDPGARTGYGPYTPAS